MPWVHWDLRCEYSQSLCSQLRSPTALSHQLWGCAALWSILGETILVCSSVWFTLGSHMRSLEFTPGCNAHYGIVFQRATSIRTDIPMISFSWVTTMVYNFLLELAKLLEIKDWNFLHHQHQLIDLLNTHLFINDTIHWSNDRSCAR